MSYTRQDIVTAARAYLGTRFKMRGRNRAEGIDCVGLLALVSADIGLKIDDTIAYSKMPDPDMFRAVINDQTKAGSINQLKSGSIVLFKQAVFPLHAGILVVENGQMTVVNASMKMRKVVEEPWEEWRTLLLGVREFPGI